VNEHVCTVHNLSFDAFSGLNMKVVAMGKNENSQ